MSCLSDKARTHCGAQRCPCSNPASAATVKTPRRDNSRRHGRSNAHLTRSYTLPSGAIASPGALAGPT
eukprot:CAMPEP_0170261304 /NCGR_PEP_ID=MMETSP0116_2-20130129/30532_1 /TAXON_ID=400756 /ORGANISM="Durinskia baltica, Strain CSIRO CS-38" /LENGTH=67 /DNA_ID=CAMNT_0010512367 /DNA_START=66 /DNA_END=265 /DNA_ORIENTATION=-